MIEDIRLTDEEKGKISARNMFNSTPYKAVDEASDTATDKAIKKIVGFMSVMNLAKNHPNCFMLALEDWEALKKLAEEK